MSSKISINIIPIDIIPIDCIVTISEYLEPKDILAITTARKLWNTYQPLAEMRKWSITRLICSNEWCPQESISNLYKAIFSGVKKPLCKIYVGSRTLDYTINLRIDGIHENAAIPVHPFHAPHHPLHALPIKKIKDCHIQLTTDKEGRCYVQTVGPITPDTIIKLEDRDYLLFPGANDTYALPTIDTSNRYWKSQFSGRGCNGAIAGISVLTKILQGTSEYFALRAPDPIPQPESRDSAAALFIRNLVKPAPSSIVKWDQDLVSETETRASAAARLAALAAKNSIQPAPSPIIEQGPVLQPVRVERPNYGRQTCQLVVMALTAIIFAACIAQLRKI